MPFTVDMRVEKNNTYRRLFGEALASQGLSRLQRRILLQGSSLAERILKQHSRGGGQPFKKPTGTYLNSIASRIIGTGSVAVGPTVVYAGWLERGRIGTRFRGYRIVSHSSEVFTPQFQTLAERLVKEHIAG